MCHFDPGYFLISNILLFCDPPAMVHSQSAQIRADQLCAVAGELQEDTSRILRITFLKSGRFRDQNDM